MQIRQPKYLSAYRVAKIRANVTDTPIGAGRSGRFWSCSCFKTSLEKFLAQSDTKNEIQTIHRGFSVKLLKSMLALALVTSTALSLTACSDEEVALGVGVVIGVIISDDIGHHHRHNPPRYRRDGRRYASAENLLALSPAVTVALKYDLSSEQAEILTAHLLPAREGDFSGLVSLGFEKRDLESLMAGQNPSARVLRIMSQKLNMDLIETNKLIQNMKADALIARSQIM